jgi:anion-transporting  ArsA/GET3 family ATPase
MTGIDRLLGQRLVVCVGSGGVGKTTIAAALACGAALGERDTAVITVDPARRLKDALGLAALSTQPHRVTLGERRLVLDALALDTKRTFDALVARVAPNPQVAERIFANRLYQELSNELGGSAEYMAMEKLHELLHLNQYHCIVVDTPPSAHARDLLGAPLRLTELLASSAVRILKTPAAILSGADSGFARMTLNAILKGLQRWTGMNLLQDLSDFAANFEHLVEGFQTRARDVEQALRGRATSFVIVTTPEPETVAATVAFAHELRQERFPIAGIIANRVHGFPPLAPSAGEPYPDPLRRKLVANYADFTALARRDAKALSALQRETHVPLLATLPVLEEPPTSLAGLRRFAGLLTAPPPTHPEKREQVPA